MTTKTVLVTGATGKQGGAVAMALLAHGHRVRALTRRPDSDAAARLRALGAEPVAGDLADAASLAKAMEGADAVFGMSTFFEAGVDAEVVQGTTLAEAAKAAGVGHLVFTSVASADRATGIPHFDSKHRVEQRIRELDVPHTIVAPVYFLENLYFPQMLDGLRNGVYAQPLPPGRKLQQVAVADIGHFGALAIEQRERFLGKRIELASVEVTGEEMAAALGKALGREVKYLELPLDGLRAMSEEMAVMYEWFDKVGYHADIEALRRDYPEVGWHSLDAWLAKQDLAAALGDGGARTA